MLFTASVVCIGADHARKLDLQAVAHATCGATFFQTCGWNEGNVLGNIIGGRTIIRTSPTVVSAAMFAQIDNGYGALRTISAVVQHGALNKRNPRNSVRTLLTLLYLAFAQNGAPYLRTPPYHLKCICALSVHT